MRRARATTQKTSAKISPGDLVRAISELGLEDPSDVSLVAGMLGYELRPAAARKAAAPSAERDADARDEGRAADGDESADEDEEDSGATPPREEQRAVAVELTSAAGGGKGGWAPDVKVKPFPPQDEDVDTKPPPLVPLLTPQWTRAILSASLATADEDAQLDLERVTEMLASCETVGRLPVVSSKTMRRGAHLLLDAGRTMMPFRRDQAWLTRAIRRVAGESHVEVLSFVGSPLRGAGAGAYPWPEYRPPPPGTPVVMLTDLGLCRAARGLGGADEAEWAKFARVVRRAGCTPVAFVPYKSSRWRSLARLMTIIRWDRSTTAATVGNILKTAAEARRA